MSILIFTTENTESLTRQLVQGVVIQTVLNSNLLKPYIELQVIVASAFIFNLLFLFIFRTAMSRFTFKFRKTFTERCIFIKIFFYIFQGGDSK